MLLSYPRSRAPVWRVRGSDSCFLGAKRERRRRNQSTWHTSSERRKRTIRDQRRSNEAARRSDRIDARSGAFEAFRFRLDAKQRRKAFDEDWYERV